MRDVPQLSRDQLCGMNFHYKHHSFEYFLDAMVRFGFRHIELWGASPHFYVDSITDRKITGIKKEIDHRNLNVVCFTPEQCVYPINLAAKEYDIRERSIQYFLRSAEVARLLGAPMLLVTPGWGYENEPREEAWKRSSDSLWKLSERAEQLDLLLALEPLTRNESNIIYDLPGLKGMLDEVGSTHLKGMVDTVPMAQAQEDLRLYLNALGDDLSHIHFIDGPDGHLAWGDGCLPLAKYMEQLCLGNYEGYLTLELTSYKYLKDPDWATKKSLETLAPFFL